MLGGGAINTYASMGTWHMCPKPEWELEWGIRGFADGKRWREPLFSRCGRKMLAGRRWFRGAAAT